MLRVCRKFLLLFLLFSLASCALLSEDLKEAKAYVSQGNYQEAINLLNKFESSYSKKYNSQVHQEYAVIILKDLEIRKLERYQRAKSLLEDAVKLDGKNKTARTYYMMLLKLIKNEV